MVNGMNWVTDSRPLTQPGWLRLSDLAFFNIQTGLHIQFEGKVAAAIDSDEEVAQCKASISSAHSTTYACPIKMQGEDAYALFLAMDHFTDRDDADWRANDIPEGEDE